MANRNFKPGAMAIEKGLICLYGRADIEGEGAIVAGTEDARGFSITPNGSGIYNITLEDNYTALRSVSTTVIDTSAIVGTEAKVHQVTAEDVVNGTLQLTFLDLATGVKADLPDGCTILIEITLKNSTVKY